MRRALTLATGIATATIAASLCAAALCAAALCAPTPARADEAVRERIARGRALTWGFAAIVPVWIGDVVAPSGLALDYYAPGGGIEGRIGFELPGGLALGVVGGISAHASGNSRAITSYRGGAEARWTIDVGEIVAPSLGVAAGLMLVELDTDLGIRPTAYARALGGVQILFEPWIVMDLGLSVEGALGLDAFRDPVVWISPQVGLSFYE